MIKIATWNVNSVQARLPLVLDWLRLEKPDVIGFQEIKCLEEKFPQEAFESLGYNVAVFGQKTYNGVALLSKYPMEDVIRGFPQDQMQGVLYGPDGRIEDHQARYIEAVILSPTPVRIGNLYLPNGNPVDTDRFIYKLAWARALQNHAKRLLALEESLILMGDYNIIPRPEDCYDPKAWEEDALYRLESRKALRSLIHLGFEDAVDRFRGDGPCYSFWDYQAGAWPKNQGIRIDHMLLSPQASDRLIACGIDKRPRGWERPSDHVPVLASLSDEILRPTQA